MTEPLYACKCAVSPRPLSTYREIEVEGKPRIICGWCCAVAVPVKVKKERRKARR